MTCEYFKLSGFITEVKDEETIISAWNTLDPKEKEGYSGWPPDICLQNTRNISDIDAFKPQEAIFYSQNFSILRLQPKTVDHSIFINKTAIGNTRKTYESLPQPDSVSKRWVHRLNENNWTITEMHVPTARP